MERLLEIVAVLMPLGVAYIIWIKWARDWRSGVIHLKLNNPTVVARRDRNPIAFHLLSAATFIVALLWTLLSPFVFVILLFK